MAVVEFDESVPDYDIVAHAGRGVSHSSHATKWREPVLDPKEPLAPKFYLKSACKNMNNYFTELRGIPDKMHLRHSIIVPAPKTFDTCEGLPALLLFRKTFHLSEYTALIQTCPLRAHLQGLDENTHREIATKKLPPWAEKQLYKLRQNGTTRDVYREQRMHLQALLQFKLSMAIMQNRGAMYSRLAECLGVKASKKRKGFFWWSHDYSTARSRHVWGQSVFMATDDVSMPPLTSSAELPALGFDSQLQQPQEPKALPTYVAFFPNHQTNAEADPSEPKKNYKATVESGVALVGKLVELFGKERVESVIRDRRTSWRDMDLGPFEVDKENSAWLFSMGLMSDQGSPEMRTWQAILQSFPGHAATAWGHKSSNMCKGLVPEVDELTAFWRAYCRASSGQHQGDQRSAVEFLRKEYATNPGKTLARPWAREVLKASNKKSLGEALCDVATFVHGSDCRWFGPTICCRSFQKNMASIRMTTRLLCTKESKKLIEAQGARVGPDHEEVQLPELDFDFVLLNLDNIDDELSNGFLQSFAKRGRKFKGWNTELGERLHRADESKLRLQIHMTEPLFAFFQLQESLNSFSCTSMEMMRSPYILKQMKRLFDPDATPVSCYSVADIHDLFAARKKHVCQEVLCSISQQLWRGPDHFRVALKLYPRVLSQFLFDNFDPQHGLFESIDRGRYAATVEALECLGDYPPFDLSVDAKRCIKAHSVGRKELITEVHDGKNAGKPFYEKETEGQFQEKVTSKQRSVAGSSGFSKEVQRYIKSTRSRRHKPWPWGSNSGALRPVKLEAVIESMEQKQSDFPNVPLSDQEAQDCLDDVHETAIKAAGGLSAAMAAQFVEMKKSLTQHHDDYKAGKWGAKITNAVKRCEGQDFTSYQPDNLGFRGVATKALLELEAEKPERTFMEGLGIEFADSKAIDFRLKEHGFFIGSDGNSTSVVMVVTTATRNSTFRAPVSRKKVTPWGDYLGIINHYVGPLKTHATEEGEFRMKILQGPEHWIEWHEYAADHFFYATQEEQLHMLGSFLEESPGLTERVLVECGPRVRQRFFRMYLDDEVLEKETIKALVQYYKPKEWSAFGQGDLIEDARIAQRNEQQAVRAAGEDNPRARREVENLQAAHGITRQRAATSYYFYKKDKDETLLGSARSHRRQQGALSDLVRLHWPAPAYRPTKVHYAPTCSSEGNVETNIRRVLLPRILREYGLTEDEVEMRTKTGLVCQLDELLFYDPCCPPPLVKPAAAKVKAQAKAAASRKRKSVDSSEKKEKKTGRKNKSQ
eukprot:g10093.t1